MKPPRLPPLCLPKLHKLEIVSTHRGSYCNLEDLSNLLNEDNMQLSKPNFILDCCSQKSRLPEYENKPERKLKAYRARLSMMTTQTVMLLSELR